MFLYRARVLIEVPSVGIQTDSPGKIDGLIYQTPTPITATIEWFHEKFIYINYKYDVTQQLWDPVLLCTELIQLYVYLAFSLLSIFLNC